MKKLLLIASVLLVTACDSEPQIDFEAVLDCIDDYKAVSLYGNFANQIDGACKCIGDRYYMELNAINPRYLYGKRIPANIFEEAATNAVLYCKEKLEQK